MVSYISPSCLCGNKLRGDGRECFGNIYSSICIVRADKIGCMSDIGIRKFGWMTSRGNRNVREVFFAKPCDCGSVYTSFR